MLVPAEIELPPPPSPTALDAIDALDDAGLDELPFGVVGLDAACAVVRYNLAEARLARLDRQAVLGQPFFVRVAPCTATDAFEGRVRRFLAGDERERRFSYVFDFRFGAQQVEVELWRGSGRCAVYLLINRKGFLPKRKEGEARAPGVTLPELRPDEAARGVRRPQTATGPASSQREALLTTSFFAALKTAWDRIAPEGGPLFSLAWGEAWGRREMIELDTVVAERDGTGLRELPTRAALDAVAAALADRGLGKVGVDFAHGKSGVVVVHVERSLLAEAAGPSSLPRCALLAGYLQAVFSHLSEKRLTVREVCCAAQGHAACSFAVVGDARRARLLELVHKKNVTAIVDAKDAVVTLVAP